MSIINLKSTDELEKIIGNDLIKIGEGAEGPAYLSKKDNMVYKIIKNEEFIDEVKDIITKDDIDLKYFLLPEDLYVYNNHLLAYKTKYIKKDLLDKKNKDNNIFKIDFDKLIIAYRNILNEIKTISNNKIKICDIVFNLLFDGENLYAIDTCGYRKIDKDINEIYKINKYYLDDALKDMLFAHLIIDINTDKYNELAEIENLEEQLNEIKKSVKR